MSKKQNSSSTSVLLAVVLVVGAAGFAGISLSLGKASVIGSLLVTVAFAESVAIVAGFFLLQRSRLSKT